VAHLRYLRYVARHKLFVFGACLLFGGPRLIWRGLIHDWHKLLPGEWIAYVRHFYGDKADKAGYDLAWLRHQRRADHHWQWWILLRDEGAYEPQPMSRVATNEMLCDWWGASRAQGNGGWAGVLGWYNARRDTIVLHDETRLYVDKTLKELGTWGP